MKTYDIAGLLVNMEAFGRTSAQAEKYKCAFTGRADIEITVTDGEIEEYLSRHSQFDRETVYYIISGFKFYRRLLGFNGFMLHSSAVSVDGSAFLFSGQSGVGKSTHTGYWQKLLGDRCILLNDDKPAIRAKDGVWTAFGTPWSGKNDLSRAAGSPLKGICFVKRGQTNKITRLSVADAAMGIISQCAKNFSDSQWDTVLGMINDITEKIPVYRLECINDISAARLSFGRMYTDAQHND